MKSFCRQYRHTLGFVAIAILLGLPLALRTLSPSLEPYPAVLLPAGAGLAYLHEDQVSFDRLDLVGLDPATGAEVRIDPVAFLGPIPIQYLHPIAANEFGHNDAVSETIRFKYLGLPSLERPRTPKDAQQRQDAAAWMQQRLIAADCAPSQLVVRRQRFNLGLADRQITPGEIVYEKHFRFD